MEMIPIMLGVRCTRRQFHEPALTRRAGSRVAAVTASSARPGRRWRRLEALLGRSG